jgi:hypothetical protein
MTKITVSERNRASHDASDPIHSWDDAERLLRRVANLWPYDQVGAVYDAMRCELEKCPDADAEGPTVSGEDLLAVIERAFEAAP